MGRGDHRGLTRLIAAVLESERLDELPEKQQETERGSFFSRLFAREVLPEDPAEPSGGRASFLSVLFCRETLPVDTAPAAPPAVSPPNR